MRKLLLLLACILTCSCQVKEGGGEIWVSDKTPTIPQVGGELHIETSGAAYCSIIEGNNYETMVSLSLMDKTGVIYEGDWYSFKSDTRGLNLIFNFDANSTTLTRNLHITLADADLYSKIEIIQK